MGVAGEDRLDWMSEYAEFHSINENAYVNASLAGMGSVLSPNPSSLSGNTLGISSTTANANGGSIGSGDLGQNLLPVAMKIAAQTIGLDLVAVKPSPGPKLDLLYIDFQYDDIDTTQASPLVFKVAAGSGESTTTDSVVAARIRTSLSAFGITETVGGLRFTNNSGTSVRVYTAISQAGEALLSGSVDSQKLTITIPAGSLVGTVEFLGFSRIDGLPIFKSFRQANAVGNSSASPFVAPNSYDATKNTFGAAAVIATSITRLTGLTASVTPVVSLVSALEDHLPGFSTNFTANSNGGQYPMSRSEDDLSYAGVIGPKVSTKSIAVGTIEVSSALRRTEIEDIKANTGMDIVQKMESILVNELSQTISKQIVAKVFEMGDLNRTSAPAVGSTYSSNISGQTIFDLDTLYTQTQVGGETTHAVQRKLITKMVHASNYIATEGRVGPAQFAVTNGGLAAALMDIAGYTINPTKSKINGSGQ
ncbi:MAG: hypothetical protein EBQ66_09965, partial [Flavobacteriia bacterium]|nr:hypothetical protein [Flavobacteriia bacterium]